MHPTEECINIPSTSTGKSSPVLPTYKDAVKTGSKPEDKDTRICMVTPHVQKRSNTSQRSSPGKKPKNNARPPIIVLDDEKEPIHDLVEPQVRSPSVRMSGVPGLNPIQSSHLSFPRNCSNIENCKGKFYAIFNFKNISGNSIWIHFGDEKRIDLCPGWNISWIVKNSVDKLRKTTIPVTFIHLN